MPHVGLTAMTQVFEQAKTGRALDCAATVIGIKYTLSCFSTNHNNNKNKTKTMIQMAGSVKEVYTPL
jgi:hypothetical protein